MQVTATMISTRGGRILPLDQRRRDALLNYCEQAAEQANLPLQTWIRRTFGFEAYEAKEVVRGNASEALWERIVKHPNGGWRVVLPVMGAVIGLSFEQFLEQEMEAIRAERDRLDELEERARAHWGLLALRRSGGAGSAGAPDPLADGKRRKGRGHG